MTAQKTTAHDRYVDKRQREQIADLRELAEGLRKGFREHGRSRALLSARKWDEKADRLEAMRDGTPSR